VNDEEIAAAARKGFTPPRRPSDPTHRTASDIASYLWAHGRECPDVRVNVGGVLIPIAGYQVNEDTGMVTLLLDEDTLDLLPRWDQGVSA